MSTSIREVRLYAPNPIPDLSLENIKRYYCYPINEAAKHLGCCTSVLKNVMRKFGVKRWPHRKIKALDKRIELSGEPETIADAITKKELLINNPDIYFTDLISKSESNRVNAKISSKLKGKTPAFKSNKACVTKKTVESKVANKLPLVILNRQTHNTKIETKPIFKNINVVVIDSETESDSDHDPDMLYIDETIYSDDEDAIVSTTTIGIENEESDSEYIDPDMLFIDETPSDEDDKPTAFTNEKNEERELNVINQMGLTFGEIECSQTQYYFLSEQHYSV